ncbi:DUF2510 domain-containing protein [Nocardioides sp. zg-ZUI104]|uniref:DUF2510 domain-containing protein n=1 Tax=Nocardioides faecalis TaxID=2803858 RepID=UPI001BCFB748|nr:DUF2510 domain-containing protein [Nocardioides faecalis]
MNDASPPSPPSPRPPGWYLDPAASSTHHRYWDGSGWTDHFRSGPADAASAVDRSSAPRHLRRRRRRWWQRS